jgi:hypothetical protein
MQLSSEHLPSIHEALGSIPSTTKKERKISGHQAMEEIGSNGVGFLFGVIQDF